MAARLIVVTDIFAKDPSQVTFAEDDHVVKAFPPDGADNPFSVGVLPGRARGDPDLLYGRECCLFQRGDHAGSLVRLPVVGEIVDIAYST